MSMVLVVDDSAVDRQIAVGCVRDAGLDSSAVASGQEAMEYLANNVVDVVLTDLQMPEMDGLELVQQIRQTHSVIPVVLMTGYGSETIAAQALRSGAASYLPKRDLKSELGQTLRNILELAESRKDRLRVYQLMTETESSFCFGFESAERQALINHLQDSLQTMNLADENELVRIGTALTEALTNAVEHGNLELDSELKESMDGSFEALLNERVTQSPYQDRRVHVRFKMNACEAVITIRDEGPGFDPSQLPDPTDPENLLKASGRGMIMIRTFMDEVSFNDHGNEITMTWRKN
ncbi:response regulator [Roseiconus nitratireducens]|uniref:Response regulator n=1 Tax=Roseiconus nitratireducens TaxID=2605748 RepID=A0A5M6DD88_9BACT|nr:response regulator [Roseiconus nitratireducens]KAA5543145.1 response regulator [Roseiconus nitratireducens]